MSVRSSECPPPLKTCLRARRRGPMNRSRCKPRGLCAPPCGCASCLLLRVTVKPQFGGSRSPPPSPAHGPAPRVSRAKLSSPWERVVGCPDAHPHRARRDATAGLWGGIRSSISCNLPKAITRVDAHTAPGHIYDECAQCAAGGREGGAGSRSVNRPRQTRSHTPPHSAPRSAP